MLKFTRQQFNDAVDERLDEWRGFDDGSPSPTREDIEEYLEEEWAGRGLVEDIAQ